MRDATPTRRRALAAVAGLAGVTAGCAGGADDGSETGSEDPTPTESADTESAATDTPRPSTDGPELDLREANVVGVAIERDGDTHDLAVTLYHDDDGEEGYADWWQVERLGGERLGRRDLRHAHSTDPFTRSETIEIPDSVGCVVVRGHDQTHGYGGRVAVVDLNSGATRSIDQGPESQSVDAGACPSR
ncbi:hypothetical protein GCM10008995_16450 [Halobellus salinus]|uniref:Uncharacterized protein n=1 Tax=Halobellus salinus TaxID=931585 RepID=A0A830EN77_9EURY|nr:hypothetical protein [Halobellus salinus]GGJ07298.1 hypothetical protein GCM10008995_16450 [Halobellus salinus]SMP25934.1 hypothetical protein SAMN06265347_11133 [Halobellus salinus]